MMKQGDRQKIWEWCGWKQGYLPVDSIVATSIPVWKSPDNLTYDTLPELTLDNLFKYAVPKLRNDGWELNDINFFYDADWITCNIELYKEGSGGLCDIKNYINDCPQNTTAEALGGAILKVIDNE